MPSTDRDSSHHQGKNSRLDLLWAGLIFAAALALRLLRSRSGLPYLHHWDEPALAFKALDMLKTGSLNPHAFNYGSLMMYLNLGVDWLYTRYLLALPAGAPQALGSLAQLEYGSATGFDWFISHPSILFWNRALTALLGAGTVLIVYCIGKKVAGRPAAISGALLLAVLGIHIEHSAYVTTDAPMTFFVWLTAWFSLLFYEKQQPKWLVLALAAGGLATSVKYNAGLCLLMPLITFLMSLRQSGYRRWLWAALPLVPLLAFSLGSPYALLDWQDFIQDALYEAQHYVEIGHGWAHVEPGLPHMQLQATAMLQNTGRVAALLALIGLVFLCKKRSTWPLLVYLLVYFLFMTRMRVSFHRNFLVFYPAICLAFGMGIQSIWQALKDLDKPYTRQAATVFLLLVGAFLAFKAGRSAQANWQIWNTPETRTQAVLYVKQLLDGDSGKRVGVAQELRLHPLDMQQIQASVTVKPYVELLDSAADYDLIIGFGRVQGSNSGQRLEAEAIRTVIDQVPQDREQLIGTELLYLDILSVDPQVSIISETQGLSEQIDFSE